ncbi:hypothetical protein KOW79_006809 [Hemibagrus wyckioides]|uniref:Septin-type G domain-containing protein n=1 Tax=Hemibagrus wyckioides TaxID=337641 RepID=A0A9D3P141_9TELE|nr:uncharacterized protein LOC131356722 isoform X1 [Hemibagrus wyckioides]XP_058251892.1 uncharacterized protein LOC131356722 isoform X1 [Hemibagrus wyckioides]XP_058251893.1 uncharacterized protein LOC131356722 isoform X2 [Hemibagrus wyckioides]XP_058251894.1 uncharacterized protein LOC131356722 isoform X2 [Hemibagrus wyckioides]KAG7330587.1 hypothetical protein KOW79_006809 [Hemibagrus wyckioides]
MATGFNRCQESSSTVHDLIQKSKLISEGPPARYHLLTTRSNLDEEGLVRKWTFGQRGVNMQNKIVLMVGETGTGKTTLINAVTNYILGVRFTDEVWFEITEEGRDNHMSDWSKCQTTKITVYEVFAQDNPICLTVIDTPGYGDTRGVEYDKQIADNLSKLFRNDTGVKEIDAVCLVVKASENRSTDRQHYIVDALLSLFGKDIENVVMFITHSDGLPPKDALNAIKKAAIPCRKNEENEPEHFLFNNRQTEKRIKKYNRFLQTAWEQTEDSLNDFFASLKEQNRKSLEQTENVLTESKRLEACISNLKDCIKFIECKGEELTQIQKALEINREKIKRNENVTFTVTKYYKEKVPIEDASWENRKVTSCSVCEENCHEQNCYRALNAGWCKVMKKKHCTVCTGKCHYTKHVRENKKYVTKSNKTEVSFDEILHQYKDSNKLKSYGEFDKKAFENVKNKFESNKKQEEEKTSIEKRLKEELIEKEKKKAKLLEEAYTTIMKLSEIVLKPDSAFIVQCLDFLIPRAEEIGREVVAQKLTDLRKIQPESQERVNAVMGYFNKLKNVVTGK